MSYVEIFVIRPNGDVESYGEAKNAFGGAIFIWDELAKKYKIGGDIVKGYNALWRSIGKMEEVDQWVLASTFDNFIIKKEQLPTFIKHLSEFTDRGYSYYDDVMKKTVHTSSDTLYEELFLLKQIEEQETDVLGVCFNQTSVNCDVWNVYEEEKEEHRPYNIFKDRGHKFLTPEYLKKRKSEK